jgi:FixJ family two-component response regulator
MVFGGTASVYIVDDDASIRESIRDLLMSVGLRSDCLASAEEFLQKDTSDGPSCLILDVSLPGISGIELQQQLRNEGRKTPIIFITGHGNIRMSVKAMKMGAVEFLTKPFDIQDLLDAVQQALARDLASREEHAELSRLQTRYDLLTRREREVMQLVVSGLINKEIASELGTREITVKVHRARVMQKMQSRSLAELVRTADRLQRLRSDV